MGYGRLLALDVVCRSCPHARPFPNGAKCGKSRQLTAEHVAAARCPAGRFPTVDPANPLAAAAVKPAGLTDTINEAGRPCSNCGGDHPSDRCPIPTGFDAADYALDAKGTGDCGCNRPGRK